MLVLLMRGFVIYVAEMGSDGMIYFYMPSFIMVSSTI
jgi:hypothetical protein